MKVVSEVHPLLFVDGLDDQVKSLTFPLALNENKIAACCGHDSILIGVQPGKSWQHKTMHATGSDF